MLTVLFATRNRAPLLRDVLEAYCRLELPDGGWSLVVVDNGSSDATQVVARSFARRIPLTCLVESTPGKNRALNTGLSAASGDLVVFTDDDAFPRSDWLMRLRSAADAHPDYAIFGGVVLPRWETPPPAWLLADVPLGPVFTITSAELTEGPMTFHDVFGPNMAVRAELLATHRFDATIGPRGTDYAMGSETELVWRLTQQGFRAWHVHDAVVEHFIRRSQMDRRWILGRAVRFGRGVYRLHGAAERSHMVRWWGVPRYLFRDLLAGAASVGVSLISLNRERLLRARWNLGVTRGQVLEAWARRQAEHRGQDVAGSRSSWVH